MKFTPNSSMPWKTIWPIKSIRNRAIAMPFDLAGRICFLPGFFGVNKKLRRNEYADN
jgi:hypothetical protein